MIDVCKLFVGIELNESDAEAVHIYYIHTYISPFGLQVRFLLLK